MGEAKTNRSYRLDDETAELLKQITQEIGGGQQEAFLRMAEAYMFQKEKVGLGEDKRILEEFEGYMSIITRMFVDAVEGKCNVRTVVRSEFQAMLHSKEEEIEELRREKEEIESVKGEAEKKSSLLQKENDALSLRVKELENMIADQAEDFKRKVADKDALNLTLSKSCAELREKNVQMEEIVREAKSALETNEKLTVSNEELSKQMEQIKKEAELDREHALLQTQKKYEQKLASLVSEQQKEVKALEKRLNDCINAKRECELEGEKKLLELKQKQAEEIEKFTARHQETVDFYQQKYMDLVEQRGSDKKNDI